MVCDEILDVPDTTFDFGDKYRKARGLQGWALDRFFATPRLLEGPEWEEAAKLLVDKRRSRPGPPEDSLNRWRGACDIAELTPNV